MHSRASLFLGLVIMACAGWAIYAAMSWPWKAALFPIVIGVPVFCLATVEVFWVLFGATARDPAMDFQLSRDLPERVALVRTLTAVAWIAGFFAGIVLLGFPAAVPLFVFLYLKLQGREGWSWSVGLALAVSLLFYGLFIRLLHIPFPAGWLQGWVGLA